MFKEGNYMPEGTKLGETSSSSSQQTELEETELDLQDIDFLDNTESHSSSKYSSTEQDDAIDITSDLENMVIKDKEEEEKLLNKKITTELGELKRILTEKEGNKEAVEQQLRSIMKNLHGLSKLKDPIEEKNIPLYKNIWENFVEIMKLKQNSSEEISAVFSDIFYEFNDFIEDEIVARTIQNYKQEAGIDATVYIEKATQQIYGRSKQEIEVIKEKNRASAVETIQQVAQKGNITLEDIVQLHTANNHGIVPKNVSKLRTGKSDVKFGKRFGIFTDDIPLEMQSLVNKANQLFTQKPNNPLSRTLYEVRAAKLHNDLLDMHPFPDRNGSTALLFLELLMTKAGYTPPATREKKYYTTVKRALGYNPVAIGLIGYEHLLISRVSGYYKGESIKNNPEKLHIYQLSEERLKRLRKNQKQGHRGAEAA